MLSSLFYKTEMLIFLWFELSVYISSLCIDELLYFLSLPVWFAYRKLEIMLRMVD